MRKLFENLRLLVLESKDLDSTQISELQKIFESHSVFYEVASSQERIDKEQFCSKEFTHIVSNNVNFPDYEFTQENYFPVITTEFIHTIVQTGKQPAVRAYSPDPTHVLKKVHLCVGNLPIPDKEAIYGGVRALGGTYSDTLNKLVTHIISNDPDEDCCYAVKSIEGCQIKIVTPEWIDDCLKLRRFIVEDPYLLFPEDADPNKLETPEYDVLKKELSTVKPRDQIFKNKKFFIASDYELNDRVVKSITGLITNSGGSVVSELTDANCFLGKYREGVQYISASRNSLSVGNLHWIYWMVEHQKWISPSIKLLHYPFVRDGLPEMKDFVITSTNFSGDARFYIKELVESLGAVFTTTLSHKNTHIITANTSGKKYTHALKWGLKIVNHLWLEETYSKWKLQPENHPKYSHYPQKSIMNQIVGQTVLDQDVLSTFYGSVTADRSTNIIEDSEEEKSSPIKKSVPSTFIQREHTPINSSILEVVSEPSFQSEVQSNPNEKLPDEKENVSESPVKSTPITPKPKALSDISTNALRPSSGRKAKDKAAAKLHSDMEDLNLFQKQQKTKDVPFLPEEVEAKKRRREEELAAKEHKKGNNDDNGDYGKTSKKSRTASGEQTPTHFAGYNISAITTGWEHDLSRTDLQLLKNVGIQLAKDFNSSVNVIISPKLMRTEKFLTGLSYRLNYVLSPEFITDVLDQYKSDPNDLESLPTPEDYSIDHTNPDSVSDLTNLTINQLLQKSRDKIDQSDKVFEGLTFNISSKLPGGTTVITKILKAHGAKDVHVIKSIKELKTKNSIKSGPNGSRILIASEKDKGLTEKAESLLKDVSNSKIVEWDWVVASIFNMDNTHHDHVVFEN